MKKPVIVLSSHVARGSVGNRAAVFALEVRGHPVWAVPTITLPFHPGHGRGTRLVPDEEQFARFLDDLAGSRWISEVGGVLTGYMASAEQATTVAGFVKQLKVRNPGLLHVCDPVMGDGILGGEGRLYVPEETAIAIRDHLAPLADILTPNRFELSWLTSKKVTDHAEAIAAARVLPGKTVLVTSMPGYMKGAIGNLLVSAEPPVFAEHRQVDNPPNGPGDLTAALFLSHMIDGNAPPKALQQTTASVFEIVANAARHGADELMLETDAGSITHPMAMVHLRNVVEPQQSEKGKRTVFKPVSL